ncbi:MAG: GGDEF domain-containing protein [Actinobacteria bacterium]|nr:GGDEF domain-containing protein [Actinomycetota bacterium]
MTDERFSGTTKFLLQSWLDLSDVIEAHPEIKKLLFDPVTGLPTTPLLFPRIRMLIEERGEVSLLALNVVRYSRIEEIYGWKVFDDVMRKIAHALESITGTILRDSDIVAELMVAGNAFVVVLSPPRNSLHMDPEARQMIAEKVETTVREILAAEVDPSVYRRFGCYVGGSTINDEPNVRLERLVHLALDRALSDSGTREAVDASYRAERLRYILAKEQVTTYIHPVLKLDDMSVVGYEALSRGPANTEFEHPDKLFRVAYDENLVLSLERLCRKKALEAAASMPEGRLMFINIEPDAVTDPELREIMTTTLLSCSGITPERIVLEITERTAITDFVTFRATLEYLRALGFGIAIDDAGAGYGSLQCLAETCPEWLKVDISLVRGIDSDETRTQLVASLVQFAEKMNVRLIAEGIETVEELRALKNLGVRYGQGFLFARPTADFPADEEFTSFCNV